MMTEHTPGPWTWNDTCLTAPAGSALIHTIINDDGCTVYRDSPVREFEIEIEANKRLIAAAPELLAAAQRAAHIMAELPDQTPQVIAARQMLVDSIKAAAPAYYGGAA